jgi:hypothetical protein
VKLYKRTIVVPYRGPFDVSEYQRMGWQLGLELVRLEHDASGDREDPEWGPRWHLYFAPSGLEEVTAEIEGEEVE